MNLFKVLWTGLGKPLGFLRKQNTTVFSLEVTQKLKQPGFIIIYWFGASQKIGDGHVLYILPFQV